MDPIAQIISGLIGVGIVMMIAPRVLAANQGKMLQNIALWIGIFLILALVYKVYGPGKLDGQGGQPDVASAPALTRADDEDKTTPDEEPNLGEDQGFMPPREE